jgi:hypothetical protein
VSSLDTRIDDLYRLPLGEFTAARNALAKTLSGEEARRVRALVKPTVIPWTVNQLYWHARPVYDRLVKAGGTLREAQLAALKGQDADVRRSAEAHRRALGDAVRRAKELASGGRSSADGDALARMLETLSLMSSPPAPGRLTALVQPAGFEALAGVQPVAPAEKTPADRPAQLLGSGATAPGAGTAPGVRETASDKARRLAAERAEAQRLEAERLEMERLAVERRRLEGEVRSAEQALAEARAAEGQARGALDRSMEARRSAEAKLEAARRAVDEHLSMVRRSFRVATANRGR